jgi:hypothetical protein
MTDSRTFTIVAHIRLADGSTIDHHESHETGVRCERTGGVIVAYSSDFAYERGEEVARELGGELLEVDYGHQGACHTLSPDLDLY